MKTLATVMVMFAIVAATFAPAIEGQTPAKPATQVCTLKVSGMTCAGCEAAVRMAARSVEGVTDVKVSYAKGNAEVTFDASKTNPRRSQRSLLTNQGSRRSPYNRTARNSGTDLEAG